MALLGMLSVAAAVVFIPGITARMRGGSIWDSSLPDPAFVAIGLAAIVAPAGMAVLLRRMRLATEVRADGLYIRFFPFHRQELPVALDGVTQIRVVRYRPLREYGGWGIRSQAGSRAYTLHGNRGVRLDYEDGTHVLIESDRPDELVSAVRTLGSP